jgi:hypothetical protein
MEWINWRSPSEIDDSLPRLQIRTQDGLSRTQDTPDFSTLSTVGVIDECLHRREPDRDLHEFSKFPTTWRYVYWKGLRSWSHTSIRWRSTDWIRRCSACDSDTKYVFCWTRKSLTHTDIISTDSQKLCIIEEVYRSGVTAMKCHLKDRMPRSGVVKSLASYKTFSDEIKDSEVDDEEATYR